MKAILSSVIVILSFHTSRAQIDTIFANDEKIACVVKEITSDAVRFSYPNEQLANSLYKNCIKKIVFSSGRVQIFPQMTTIKTVASPEDFDMVTITRVEGEIKGLYRLTEIGAKARGTTSYSNVERVKERAYRKIKINAAMNGANAVYLTQEQTESNKLNFSTITNLAGVAYSYSIPSYNEFISLLKDKRVYTISKKYRLNSSGALMKVTTNYKAAFHITDIISESGLIYIIGSTQDFPKGKFRVSHLSSNSFNVTIKDKNNTYNYYLIVN